MPIPTVTFPIKQDDIRSKRDELSNYLKGLQAEQKIVYAMLQALRDLCTRKHSSGECIDCGHIPNDWGDR